MHKLLLTLALLGILVSLSCQSKYNPCQGAYIAADIFISSEEQRGNGSISGEPKYVFVLLHMNGAMSIYTIPYDAVDSWRIQRMTQGMKLECGIDTLERLRNDRLY